MPLIDAYIKCGAIQGSYSNPNKSRVQEESHDGWSEIYSFSYTIKKGYPEVTITKPVDAASNNIYVYYLRTRSRDQQKGKTSNDQMLDEVKIHLCRWFDLNSDGEVDSFKVYLRYTLKDCRVLKYDCDIDAEADDVPGETITIGFRSMSLTYLGYRQGKKEGDRATEIKSDVTWDFLAHA